MADLEIPFGNEAENALKNFNKRAMGALAPHFQKGLATATEPFFRCNMGQRYLTGGSLGTGIVLWLAAAGLCNHSGMLAAGVAARLGWEKLALFLYQGNKASVGIGLGVAALFAFLGQVDRTNARERQFAGVPRHSMSRGEPRLKDSAHEAAVRLVVSVGLLVFAPPVGVLFIVSQFFCAALVAKQQEALMSRYLDALDQKIEGECLQDALLGKCPPEVTYLYKPLPETLNPELRANIAAAACGKPVKIVAQAPKPISAEAVPPGMPVAPS